MSFTDLIKKHRIVIKGIINVGAFEGREIEEYFALGIPEILIFEPSAKHKDIEGKYRGRLVVKGIALGDYEGSQNMVVTGGNGSGNSFYQPKVNGTVINMGAESIKVSTLQRLRVDRGKYNFISIDTNGSELIILKGAIDFLTTFNGIYIALNNSERYNGAPAEYEISNFLKPYHFELVETVLQDGVKYGLFVSRGIPMYSEPVKNNVITNATLPFQAGAGKEIALPKSPYIKNEYLLELNDNVVTVPARFRERYHSDEPILEEVYFTNFKKENEIPGMVYLPVMWTGFYSKWNEQENQMAFADLYNFIGGLDKSKKYYTICQLPTFPDELKKHAVNSMFIIHLPINTTAATMELIMTPVHRFNQIIQGFDEVKE